MARRGFAAVMAVAAVVGLAGEVRAQFYGNMALPGSTAVNNSSVARSLGNVNRNMSGRAGSMFSGAMTSLGRANTTMPGMPGMPNAAQMGRTGAGTGTSMSNSEWLIQRMHGAGTFVGANSGDQGHFVGAQQSDESTAPGTPGAAPGTAAGSGLGSGIGNLLNRAATVISGAPPGAAPADAATTQKATTMYYPPVTVGFEYSPRSVTDISSTLARQVMATPTLRVTSPIEVSVEGGIATFRGEVASERDRALIEQMALFEPGISAVRNLLTLKAPSSPSPRPAAGTPPSK